MVNKKVEKIISTNGLHLPVVPKISGLNVRDLAVPFMTQTLRPGIRSSNDADAIVIQSFKFSDNFQFVIVTCNSKTIWIPTSNITSIFIE